MRTPILSAFIVTCISNLLYVFAVAQSVHGTVTDRNGRSVAYASVYVKNSKSGTVTNPDGKYQLDLAPGTYTLICAHIGFEMQERSIVIPAGQAVLADFTLGEKQVELGEVVVKPGGEDPAYEIIRKAIAKRKTHLRESAAFQSEVYMKGLIRSLKVPKAVLGQKVKLNNDIIDSTGKGIIYFSESVTRYSKRGNGDIREEVISAKLSGNSSGFGFNSPQDLDINFYDNNIAMEGVNDRGFISPLHDNALHYYRYVFQGSFYENGVEINKIAVVPRRVYEPLFAGGYINIVEGSWRLHSAKLMLTKTSQIQLVDTMVITQELAPANSADIWLPRYTRIEAGFGLFGFRAAADFVSVYRSYVLTPLPDAFWKGNIVKVIDTSANKKTLAYWDSLRPIPLSVEEQVDYVKKDALEKKFKDPAYLDSLDRIANQWRLVPGIIGTQIFSNRKRRSSWEVPGLLNSVSYNTVEQWAFNLEPVYRRSTDTGAVSISPRLRYNTGLNRFYADVTVARRFGRDYRKRWDITAAGGRYIFQINPDNPIQPLNNTFATLLYMRNFMKIYEKDYARVAARKALGSTGMVLTMRAAWENRTPLENTDTTYRWRNYKDRSYTSNYPEELPPGNFEKHQAFITGITLTYQPGVTFVQYPNRLISQGSDAPVFSLQLTKAWRDILGSDAEFGKWLLQVTDEVNMKLGGTLNYQLSSGGFIRNQRVQLPDWQHFMGNQTIVASPYVRSYQLAPYYANSTGDDWFAAGHVEWKLKGLLTNKIPVFRKTNIGIVTGSNAFYVDKDRHYFEVFAGLENILKTFRVDYVWGWDGTQDKWVHGIVIGFGGLFSGGN